jgi:hypothetical protein
MLEMPFLSILRIDHLLIHEQYDEQRANPLILKIRTSKVIRNPAVVIPLNDGTNRFMVLDGANRVTALRQLGIRHVLSQVVEPDAPGLTLYNWNHVVWELDALRFIQGIQRVPGIQLVYERNRASQPNLMDDCQLALVQDCHGRLLSICSQADTLEERVEILNEIVDSYQYKARLDRTSVQDVIMLEDIYPTLAGLVIFPKFNIDDLLKLAGKACLLPAGITRFSIAPRALHLDYPLSELAADKSIEEKNQSLENWIRERVSSKRVRYYAEPTYLFDE